MPFSQAWIGGVSPSRQLNMTCHILRSAMSEEAAKSRNLKLIAVKAGSTVTKNVAAGLISSHLITLSSAQELASAVSAMACAQAQLMSKGLLLVKLPVCSPDKLKQFSQLVLNFASQNPRALAEVEKMTMAGAAGLSLKSNVIGTVVAGAIQEGLAFSRFVATGNAIAFRHEATLAAGASVGALVFGAGGAAIGTLLFPGAGAVLGSFLGSFVGSSVGAAAVTDTPEPVDAQDGFGTDVPRTVDEGDVVVVLLPGDADCGFPEESSAFFKSCERGEDAAVFVEQTPCADSELLLFYADVE
jgi:hypothetical protein